MNKDVVSDAYVAAARKLGAEPEGPLRFGWQNRTASGVASRLGERYWLRLQTHPKDRLPGRLWTGNKSSSQIVGVRKPEVVDEVQWSTQETEYRAEVMTFVDQAVVSSTPNLTSHIELTATWLSELKEALTAVRSVATERVNTRQDLVTRRITERFGSGVNTTVAEWDTAHGDLHWANITLPSLWILDWEGWGLAPKGFDVALLRGYSLGVPQVARQLKDVFEDELESPEGLLSRAFVCAELMRMIELYGDHPDLKNPLREEFGILRERRKRW